MATNTNPTKVIIPCRISFANIWQPKAINGGDENILFPVSFQRVTRKPWLVSRKQWRRQKRMARHASGAEKSRRT